jgi:hypothetical protein
VRVVDGERKSMIWEVVHHAEDYAHPQKSAPRISGPLVTTCKNQTIL